MGRSYLYTLMFKVLHILAALFLLGTPAVADELAELRSCLTDVRSSADSYLRFVPGVFIAVERTIGSNLEHLEVLERTTEELALATGNPDHDRQLGFATSNGLVSCTEFRRTFRLQLRQLLLTLGAASLSALVAFFHLCFSIFHQPRNRRNEDSWVSAAVQDQPQDRKKGFHE